MPGVREIGVSGPLVEIGIGTRISGDMAAGDHLDHPIDRVDRDHRLVGSLGPRDTAGGQQKKGTTETGDG